jgi:predicted transposase YdaD
LEFNRFDVSAKELVWDDPTAWLDRLRIGPPGPVEVIDSDITALTAAADKVVRVGGPDPYLVNFELQSSHQMDLAETIWFQQAALFHRHRLPVLTVLVLLRREANSPSLTGCFEINMPDGWLTNRYNYQVVRLWREDPEPYLTAGVNLVPLAPLASVAEVELPRMVDRMAARINAEPAERAAKLWAATYLLMGLCYSEDLVAELLEGVQNMQESTTYQAILREGRNEGLIEGRNEGLNEGRNEGRITEAHRLLLLQGEIRFGAPDEATRIDLEAIRDVERLERISKRLLDANIRDWNELLGTL